jgi:hypothetical protein
MPNLENAIQSLASTFAINVLTALRGASITELLSIAGSGSGSGSGNGAKRSVVVAPPKATAKRGGRLARRSNVDLSAMVSQIVSTLAQHETGLRSEELRAMLGVDKKELPRPLKEGLASGSISKKGQKRATVYFASKKKSGK